MTAASNPIPWKKFDASNPPVLGRIYLVFYHNATELARFDINFPNGFLVWIHPNGGIMEDVEYYSEFNYPGEGELNEGNQN